MQKVGWRRHKMKSRFYPKAYAKQLATEMWGTVFRRDTLKEGLWFFACEGYRGCILCDSLFRLHPILKANYPWELLVYQIQEGENRYYAEEIEGSVEREIHFYAFEADSLSLLFYYHPSLIKKYADIELGKEEEKTKEVFLKEERKKHFRTVVLNYPEFVKKTDRKKAYSLVDQIYQRHLLFEKQMHALPKEKEKALKEQWKEKKNLMKKRREYV